MWPNVLILAVTLALGFGVTYLLDFTQSPPASTSSSTLSPDNGPNAAIVKAGHNVPEFQFVTLDGKAHRISDFQGRRVVLNFWASWCAPCVKEFPLFLDMAETHTDDLVFIALSSDFEEESMNRFINKMRAQHEQAFENGNVLIALDQNGAITRDMFQTFRLPETILIDKKGIMREKLIGADWGADDLNAMLSGL